MVNFRIDVSEFYECLDRRDIEEFIDMLAEDGYIKRSDIIGGRESNSMMGSIWDETCVKLSKSRLFISNADEEAIQSICDKY